MRVPQIAGSRTFVRLKHFETAFPEIPASLLQREESFWGIGDGKFYAFFRNLARKKRLRPERS